MSDDDVRARLHSAWGSAAGSWGEHAEFIDRRAAQVTESMLELVRLEPGQRVLELASGPGGVGLAAAEAVGPRGEVVISDVVGEMTSIARERSEALGLTNVVTRELDLESIGEPDAAYDAVLCRDGIMLVPDPAVAASEILRILRPDGRAAVAVWGERERNPWLGVLLDAASAQLGAPIPPPAAPGPFSLSDPGVLAALLSDSGFAEVAVNEVEISMQVSSFDEWWSRVSALSGSLRQVLASLPQDASQAIRDWAQEGLVPYTVSAGLEIPGLSLVAGGRQAGHGPL
jgi:SAM-dependent methyltransferase